MEDENLYDWFIADDMPHKEFMDDNDLQASDFSDSLKQKLGLFEIELAKMLEDGILSKEEYFSLHAHSVELEKLIRKELDSKRESSQTGVVVAFIIGIGAIIGLGKIFK